MTLFDMSPKPAKRSNRQLKSYSKIRETEHEIRSKFRHTEIDRNYWLTPDRLNFVRCVGSKCRLLLRKRVDTEIGRNFS